VGLTEQAASQMTSQIASQITSQMTSQEIIKVNLPMNYSGRFAAENSFTADGTIKIIADASNNRILGIHAVGAYASEFIWGGAVLIEQELRIQDVKELIFPHPTVCELIKDAVWQM
jgi:dihydrolipoamide dehydrogenase